MSIPDRSVPCLPFLFAPPPLGPPSFQSAIYLNPFRPSARDFSELGLRRMVGLRPRPRVPGPPCLCLPMDLHVSVGRPPTVSPPPPASTCSPVFVFVSVSLCLCPFHTSPLFGASRISLLCPLHQLGVKSRCAVLRPLPGPWDEKGRVLTWPRSGPWVPIPAVPCRLCDPQPVRTVPLGLFLHL